jgi:CBS domain
LASANKDPLSITPESSLSKAISIMLTHDFSQLPVIKKGKRDVKGAISWESIGSRLVFNQKSNSVKDYMEEASVIEADKSLFEAINKIEKNEYVLVRASDETICGIVTAYDLAEQFKNLASPFIFIGEIENNLRKILHGKFTKDELENSRNPNDSSRVIEGLADLTFGEYVRLLESPGNWEKLKLAVDRKDFITQLNSIREIRNDVMHFDPQGIDSENFKKLKSFMNFLNAIRRCSKI